MPFRSASLDGRPDDDLLDELAMLQEAKEAAEDRTAQAEASLHQQQRDFEAASAEEQRSIGILKKEYEEGLSLMASFLGTKDTAIALLKERCHTEAERKDTLAALKERGTLKALKKKMEENTLAVQEADQLKQKLRDAKHKEILHEKGVRSLTAEKDKEIAGLQDRLKGLQSREADFTAAIKRSEDDKARIAGLEAALVDLRSQLDTAEERYRVQSEQLRTRPLPAVPSPQPPRSRQRHASISPPNPPSSTRSLGLQADLTPCRPADPDEPEGGWHERCAALEREVAVVGERCELYAEDNDLLRQEIHDAIAAAAAAESAREQPKQPERQTPPLPPRPPKHVRRMEEEHKKVKERLAEALALSLDLKGALNESRAKNKRQEDRLLIKNAELIEIDKRAKRLQEENDDLTHELEARRKTMADLLDRQGLLIKENSDIALELEAHKEESDVRSSLDSARYAEREEMHVSKVRQLQESLAARDHRLHDLEQRLEALQRSAVEAEEVFGRERSAWEAKERDWEASPQSSSPMSSSALLHDMNAFERYDKAEERALFRTIARQNEMIASLKVENSNLRNTFPVSPSHGVPAYHPDQATATPQQPAAEACHAGHERNSTAGDAASLPLPSPEEEGLAAPRLTPRSLRNAFTPQEGRGQRAEAAQQPRPLSSLRTTVRRFTSQRVWRTSSAETVPGLDETGRTAQLEKTLVRQNEVIRMLKEDLLRGSGVTPDHAARQSVEVSADHISLPPPIRLDQISTTTPRLSVSPLSTQRGAVPHYGSSPHSNKYLTVSMTPQSSSKRTAAGRFTATPIRMPHNPEDDALQALEVLVLCIAAVRRHVRSVQRCTPWHPEVSAMEEQQLDAVWRERGLLSAAQELSDRMEEVLSLNAYLASLRSSVVEAWRGWDGRVPASPGVESDTRGAGVDNEEVRAAWNRLQHAVLQPPTPAQAPDVEGWRTSYRNLLEEMTALETAVLTHPNLRQSFTNALNITPPETELPPRVVPRL